MSDKFGNGRDPYLYPGIDVMRNALDIHQAQRLEQAAWELTALRAATLELGLKARGLRHSSPYLSGYLQLGGRISRSGYLPGRHPFLPFCLYRKRG